MLGLVALFARSSHQRLADALALRSPPLCAILGAALVGCSAWAFVAITSEWLLPAPRQLVEDIRNSIVDLDSSRGFSGTLFLMALSPAICEEALFRGPILRGLRTRLHPVTAVLLTGLLFGLFHLDLYRLLPTAILGIFLGFLALGSKSILPPILAHFCNNTMLITLAWLGLDQRMDALRPRATTGIFLASLALTAAGFLLVWRSHTRA
jgi:membrane protease YdiL (CAAX protease family)